MQMLYPVTITSQGQITIPAKLRRELDLDKTKRLILKVEDQKIIAEKEPDILDFRGIFKTNKKIPFRKIRESFGDYLAKRHLSANK